MLQQKLLGLYIRHGLTVELGQLGLRVVLTDLNSLSIGRQQVTCSRFVYLLEQLFDVTLWSEEDLHLCRLGQVHQGAALFEELV